MQASVETIARRAGVSRATFYVYFGAKRDAFLAVAQRSADRFGEVLAALDGLASDPSDRDLRRWLGILFDYFDEFGSFATVWRQAAWSDDALRDLGWQAQREWAARFGASIDRLGVASLGDRLLTGFAVEAMLEALWSSVRLAQGDPDATRDSRKALATGVKLVRQLIGGS